MPSDNSWLAPRGQGLPLPGKQQAQNQAVWVGLPQPGQTPPQMLFIHSLSDWGRAGVSALHQALSQAPGHSGPALEKLKSKEEGRQTASEQSSQRVGNAMEKRKQGWGRDGGGRGQRQGRSIS